MAERTKAGKRGTTTRKTTSRKKAESIDWPAIDGVPMIQISVCASELIPTGDYANVTVGPVAVTKFIPDDGKLADHLNGLAEIVEADCIAEQREIVLGTLKADVEKK